MNRADSTPTPFEVDIPRAVDSTPGVTFEAEKEGRIRGSRGLMKTLVFPGVIAATLLGPHARDAVNDYNQQEAMQQMADMRNEPVPRSLKGAQSTAQGELFGEGDDAHKNLQKILKSTAAHVQGAEWQLPAGQFVSPDQAQISEDGKTVEIGGQNYSFAQVRGKEGSYYVVAARPVHEDKLLSKDRTHMVNPMLIGGSKYQEGMADDEILDKAYTSARENLKEALEQYNGREFAKEFDLKKDELIAQK